DRSPFRERAIRPGFVNRPGSKQTRTSGRCGFTPLAHAARRRARPGESAGSGQRIAGKLAAGTRSPPSGEIDGSTGGAKSEVVTVVVGAGAALAAPAGAGGFVPASRPGLAGGGAGGVGTASPAGAPVAGRDGEDGAGPSTGGPAGAVSGAAL